MKSRALVDSNKRIRMSGENEFESQLEVLRVLT